MLDARNGIFTLSTALERDVVNVRHEPKDDAQRALLELSLRMANPIKIEIAAGSFIVGVRAK